MAISNPFAFKLTTMQLTELASRLSDATLRIEQCIPLFGALNGGESFSEALEDFASDLDAEDLARLWPDVAAVLDLDADPDSDELIGALAELGKNGWLVQIATPVMRFDAAGSSYSWGEYYTHWLYADTMGVIVEQAEAWAQGLRVAERAKAGLPAKVAG